MMKLLLFLCCAIAQAQAPAPVSAGKPDYSKEAFVVENYQIRAAFNADGTGKREETARVRIQSPAALERFGVLVFWNASQTQRFELLYARVHKADGTTVETAPSSMQETGAAVSSAAPMYSDVKELQLPVKGLAVGDVLEYATRATIVSPLIKDHFWTEFEIPKDAVVLEWSASLDVPAAKYVQVRCPKLQAVVKTQEDRKLYTWTSSQLKPTVSDAKADAEQEDAESSEEEEDGENANPAIRISTFHSWQEFGDLAVGLFAPRVEVTPEIRAKAAEVTRGLTGDEAKQRALYNYVATQIRYVSISFGIGRLQPHAAGEIFSNGYGDCKDKHTLLAAFFKASGYESWPVLISTGPKLDAEIPSPDQFDHLITAMPRSGGGLQFLDSTNGVAPFGALMAPLRDRQALVVPTTGAERKAFLAKTPPNLPFTSVFEVGVKGSLTKDAVLDAHIDITVRGDAEMFMRLGMQSIPPTQWRGAAETALRAMGYGGEVQGASFENLNDLEKPLRLSTEYHREDFPNVKAGSLRAPFPDMGGLAGVKKPKSIRKLGEPRAFRFHAEIKLPPGFAVNLAPDVRVENTVAAYSAKFEIRDGTLFVTRTLEVKAREIHVKDWEAFEAVADAVSNGNATQLSFSATGSQLAATGERSVPAAHEAIERGVKALQSGQVETAADEFTTAERLNPHELGLWAAYGFLHQQRRDYTMAIADYRRENERQPGNVAVLWNWVMCARALKQPDAEMEPLRMLVKAEPTDVRPAHRLTELLIKKDPRQALDVIKSWTDGSAGDSGLLFRKGQALLALGKTDEALSAWKEYVDKKPDAERKNMVGYELADRNLHLDVALKYTTEAVKESEEGLKDLTIDGWGRDAAVRLSGLAAQWDSLGWTYFRMGRFAEARPYLEAAWQLTQQGDVADHLGQLLERTGHKPEAAEYYRLALVGTPKSESAQQHLDALNVPEKLDPLESTKMLNGRTVPALKRDKSLGYQEELGKLRTFPVHGLELDKGSAEFLELSAHGKVLAVKFLSGDEALQSASGVLERAGPGFKLPDDGDEKVVRRGILSCSQYSTPHCSFTAFTLYESLR